MQYIWVGYFWHVYFGHFLIARSIKFTSHHWCGFKQLLSIVGSHTANSSIRIAIMFVSLWRLLWCVTSVEIRQIQLENPSKNIFHSIENVFVLDLRVQSGRSKVPLKSMYVLRHLIAITGNHVPCFIACGMVNKSYGIDLVRSTDIIARIFISAIRWYLRLMYTKSGCTNVVGRFSNYVTQIYFCRIKMIVLE